MHIEYIILIGIALIIFGLTTYIYRSTKTNEKIAKVDFSTLSDKKFGEIDFYQSRMVIYSSRNKNKITRLSLAEFHEAIDPMNVASWDKWLNKLKEATDIQQEAVSLFVNRLFGFERVFLKCSLRKLTGSKAYIRFDLIPQINLIKSSYTGAMDLKQFYRQLNDFALDLSTPTGTLFCINFAMFDNLVNRYGPKVINPYMDKLNELVYDFKGTNLIRGHLEKDIFLFYKHGLIQQMNINSFVQKLINHFEKSLEMDDFTFDLYPYVGILLLGEFHKSVHANVVNVQEATKKGVELDKQITFYDASMEEKNKEIEAWRYEILAVMKNKNYGVDFYPIVSLLSGNEIGHYLHLSYQSKTMKDFKTLYRSSSLFQLHNDLFAVTIKSSLNRYKEMKKKHPLWLFCEVRNLEVFEKIYLSNPEFKKIDITLMITNYEELNIGKKQLGIFQSLKALNVSLGVVAHPTMQTMIFDVLHEFSFLIIPHEMLESNDERVAIMLRSILANVTVLNLQTMVYNVSSYAIAERAKGYNLDFINGPLFDDRNDDIISVRKIAKLIEGTLNKR